MVTTRPPKTIVKPTALGPVANTDTKLLIYGLFQKGRVLAQDGVGVGSTQRQRCNLARSPAAVPSGSGLSSVSSVIMMETTDLWNGFHLAHRRRLYPARLGRVLLKRQMSPARMIVVDVFA